MKLTIVCVLYNSPVDKILSFDIFLNFCKEHDAEILILDNSDNEINKDYKSNTYVKYISNNGNIGLSKAYNKALAMADNDSWILFADDDTLFTSVYLNSIYSTIQNTKYEIISGLITANDRPFSPIRKIQMKYNKDSYIVNPGDYKNIYCINSGLCVYKKLLVDIGGFDETLFLDMIDYWLMDKLIEMNRNHILVIDSVLSQNFSGYSNDRKAAIKRYKIWKIDFCNYCKLTKKSAYFRIVTILKRRIKISLM